MRIYLLIINVGWIVGRFRKKVSNLFHRHENQKKESSDHILPQLVAV